jgi:hypothetical protein
MTEKTKKKELKKMNGDEFDVPHLKYQSAFDRSSKHGFHDHIGEFMMQPFHKYPWMTQKC